MCEPGDDGTEVVDIDRVVKPQRYICSPDCEVCKWFPGEFPPEEEEDLTEEELWEADKEFSEKPKRVLAVVVVQAEDEEAKEE